MLASVTLALAALFSLAGRASDGDLDPRLRVGLTAQPAEPRFELQDGDRIVWIGSTIVEREQRYGFWETALHAAFPDKQFTHRNLGWSGDTVYGDARAGFETPAKGFKDLVKLTLDLKPTVIFVSYGANESFEGEAGLSKFEKGLDTLLDALKPAKARLVLFSPAALYGGIRGVDVVGRHKQLHQYADVIRKTAAARGAFFADLQEKTLGISVVVTDNGVHPTEDGYKNLSWSFLAVLGTKNVLPDWKKLEPLRQAVLAKNELFFHRWRPQNETYLFGFRKAEQGKNAIEIPQFDPIVVQVEERIRKLSEKGN